MSSRKTTNLGLNKWTGADFVKREDFIEDNEIIDRKFASGNTSHKHNGSAGEGARLNGIEALQDGSVPNEKLASGIHGGKIINDSIPSAKLSKGSDAEKIRLANLSEEVRQAIAGTAPIGSTPTDASVTTPKLADRSVTFAKMNLSDVPVITFYGPITIDPVNRLITFPSGIVAERGVSWKEFKPSDYGLTKFEFSYAGVGTLDTYIFDYENFRANTMPFVRHTAANMGTWKPKDKVILTTMNHSFNSEYPMKYINREELKASEVSFIGSGEVHGSDRWSLYEKARFVPMDPIIIDRRNHKIRMPRNVIVNTPGLGSGWTRLADRVTLTDEDLTFTYSGNTASLDTFYFDYQRYVNNQNPYVKMSAAQRPPARLHDTVIATAHNGAIFTPFDYREKGARQRMTKIMSGGGPTSHINFNFTASKIILETGWVMADSGIIQVPTHEIDLTTVWKYNANGGVINELYYLVYDFTENRFQAHHFSTDFTNYIDNAKGPYAIVAIFWGNNPSGVNIQGGFKYRVNGIDSQENASSRVFLTFHKGKIKIDRTARKVTIPNFFLYSPRGWQEIKSSDYNNQPFVFDFASTFVGITIAFDEAKHREEMRKTDPATRSLPFRQISSAVTHSASEILIFTSIDGTWHSPYAKDVEDSADVVNTSPKVQPYYTLYENGQIQVDRVRNTVTLPTFMVNSWRGGWREVKPSDFGLQKWEFPLSTGFNLHTVVFNEKKLREELEKTDVSTRQSPFRTYDTAIRPSDPENEVIFFQMVSGKITSHLFPIDEQGGKGEAVQKFHRDLHKFILPQKLFLIEDEDLPIYKSSIISAPNNLDLVKTAIVYERAGRRVPVREYFYEDYYLNTEKNYPAQISFRMKNYDDKNMQVHQTVQIVKKSIEQVTNKAPKIAMIGDSLTQGNMPDYVKQRLAQFGINANMIGSMANTGGTMNEGRGSWTYQNYIGKDNLVSNSVITRSTSGTSNWGQNPFLKLATAEDIANHPEYCFRNTGANQELSYVTDSDKTGDFYIFDYAWYLQSHNVATPDVVTIALSTNDIWQYSEAQAIEWSRKSMVFMVQQIKKAVPTAKIAILTPAWGSNNSGDTYWSNQVQRWIEWSLVEVKELQKTHSDVDVLPLWCHMNRDFDFSDNGRESLSSTNASQVVTQNEYVHYHDEGKKSYSNAVCHYLVNVI